MSTIDIAAIVVDIRSSVWQGMGVVAPGSFMLVFNIGEHVLYRQSAPNLEAIRSLCLWSNNAAELYQQEYALGKYSCLAEIVQIHSADEDEGEPEIFVLKPLSNLETFNTGNEYAFRCEIEKAEGYA